MYSDISKHHPRERYLVAKVERNTLHLRKFAGKQLRSNTISAKFHEVYHAGNTSQQQIRSPASIDPPIIPEQPSGEPPAELVTPPEADPAPLTICSPAPDETQQQSVSCTDPDSSTDSDTNQEPLTDQPTPRRVLPKRARPKPAWTKDYQMGRGEEEE